MPRRSEARQVARKGAAAALALARERPEIGKVRAARELRSRGIHVSPSGVHAIWERNGLASSYERLVSRARSSDSKAGALSEAQRALLKRRKISRAVDHPRRERLIEVAARVFNQKGYEAASLREICEAAGILPGSMYHHFRSKEDLYVTLHAEGFRQVNEAVERALNGKTEPWERLEAAIAAHLEELVKHSDVPGVTGASLFHAAPPGLQRRLNRDRNTYENRFRKLIAALNLAPDVDQTLLRLSLLGAMNWTRIWFRPGKKSPRQIAHHLVSKILRQHL
jgi:TetR/AcrR family transcriptional regulator, cholesterol catabolism regulator